MKRSAVSQKDVLELDLEESTVSAEQQRGTAGSGAVAGQGLLHQPHRTVGGPVAQARALAISAEIWRDYQQGNLDWTLSRYKPLVDGQDPELMAAMQDLMVRKRQGSVTQAYRVLKRFAGPLKADADVAGFLRWMESEGLSASTRLSILSTIRSVQPTNQALAAAVIRVRHRCVQEEVLSKGEIHRVLEDLRINEDWYYPCFAVWLGTGLRNAELIGLTWDCVRLEDGELLITKTLKRDGVYTHKRQWSGTKTGKGRVVPLREDLVELLQEHKDQMGHWEWIPARDWCS